MQFAPQEMDPKKLTALGEVPNPLKSAEYIPALHWSKSSENCNLHFPLTKIKVNSAEDCCAKPGQPASN